MDWKDWTGHRRTLPGEAAAELVLGLGATGPWRGRDLKEVHTEASVSNSLPSAPPSPEFEDRCGKVGGADRWLQSAPVGSLIERQVSEAVGMPSFRMMPT